MRPDGSIPPGTPGRPSPFPPSRPGPGEPSPVAAEGSRVRVLVRALPPGSASRRAREVVREVLRQAGLDGDAVADAELVVAELAANAERHARPPYEVRIFSLNGVPAWCEVVDGDPDAHEVAVVLGLLRLVKEIDAPLLVENGRGLLLVHRLSSGHCHVHPATAFTTATPGKAVAFALPTLAGPRLMFP
ncbi:ATP-binding protein [Streptosporangium sp. NPDC004379]|uniref:ATP-binding protein n=1 Tax=Streptosporangium sp. NPDC004379 TaxID=3366189 RepID=UPI0036BFB0FB